MIYSYDKNSNKNWKRNDDWKFYTSSSLKEKEKDYLFHERTIKESKRKFLYLVLATCILFTALITIIIILIKL